jgi:photosystem II stability/assembly factor-like uncharacterized protein
MKRIVNITWIIATLLLIGFKSTDAQTVKGAKNGIAFQEKDKCGGWPANNGIWTWNNGKEILVGYTYGNFVEVPGHNIEGYNDTFKNYKSRLARSTDGGKTWKQEDPSNFVGDGLEPVASPGQINFEAPGFAMRVEGVGYHGSLDPKGAFFVSENRGKSWSGPYRFNGLSDAESLNGMVITARTSYIVTGKNSCLLFMAARPEKSKPGGIASDKAFVAETNDGGKSFRFISWIVPLSDPYRAVMPSVARLKDGSIVASLRRRNLEKDSCWVDAYSSTDNGKTWTFLSRVGETGKNNGNPPALVALKDGRIACVYGDRTRVKLFARISSDGGKSWGEEIIVRDDFQTDKFGDKDFGYPRLAVNHKNKLVALYYWATKENPQQHIAATIWKP